MHPAAFALERQFLRKFPGAIGEAVGSFVHDDWPAALAVRPVIPGVGPDFPCRNRTERNGHLIFLVAGRDLRAIFRARLLPGQSIFRSMRARRPGAAGLSVAARRRR